MSQDIQEPDEDQPGTDVAVPETDPKPAVLDPLIEFGISIPADAPVAKADQTLDIGGDVVFRLDVARIDRAEQFYHEVFEMDIVCRAWRLDDDSWEVTTDQVDWARELFHGHYPELVVLQRPGWTIVLHGMGRGHVLTSPKLGDAEVPVSQSTMLRLRAFILMRAYTVVQDTPDRFSFRDPYAVVWTLVVDE